MTERELKREIKELKLELESSEKNVDKLLMLINQHHDVYDDIKALCTKRCNELTLKLQKIENKLVDDDKIDTLELFKLIYAHRGAYDEMRKVIHTQINELSANTKMIEDAQRTSQ